jgi:hypothetical protein
LHPIMRGTLVVVDPLTRSDGMISALEPSR